MKQARRILFSAVVITLLLLIGMVGRLDYEDELAEEAFYQEMVCSGHWPDFDNLLTQGDCDGVENSERY